MKKQIHQPISNAKIWHLLYSMSNLSSNIASVKFIIPIIFYWRIIFPLKYQNLTSIHKFDTPLLFVIFIWRNKTWPFLLNNNIYHLTFFFFLYLTLLSVIPLFFFWGAKNSFLLSVCLSLSLSLSLHNVGLPHNFLWRG